MRYVTISNPEYTSGWFIPYDVAVDWFARGLIPKGWVMWLP
jgi:hypothetical protein